MEMNEKKIIKNVLKKELGSNWWFFYYGALEKEKKSIKQPNGQIKITMSLNSSRGS